MRVIRKKKGHIILPRGQELTPASFLMSVPVYSPMEISDRLSALGYHGQDDARRAVCLCAYRHVKRLRNVYLEKVPRRMLAPRSNTLLMGPTGCGKSYMIELLFGEILKLPYVIVEMTRFTESGYIGDDVHNIINQLIDQVSGRVDIAQCGVVALDEFDKIAANSSTLIFGGGSTKDVSGLGVQRELLKMLEGADIIVPTEYSFTYMSGRASISTKDITFFALGAFTGFNQDGFGIKNVGFKCQNDSSAGSEIAYNLDERDANNISNFQSYGFLPELIARFSHVIPFQALDHETLLEILDLKIMEYEKEFLNEGFVLRIHPRVRQTVVEKAVLHQTGARGLDTILMQYLKDIAFNYFGQHKKGHITLTMKKGQFNSEVRLSA